MRLGQRVYRTTDGRLVLQGDPNAAYLEYPAGTEVSDHTARKLGLAEEKPPARGKSRSKPQDKSAEPGDDKSE